jgi:hypothetical protein
MTIAEEISSEDLPVSEIIENAAYVATIIEIKLMGGVIVDRTYTFSDDSRMTIELIATTQGARKGVIMDNWISVNDRLPTTDEYKNEQIVLCATTSGVCVAWLSRKNGLFLDEWRGSRLPFNVTHWQPLPAPPS